MCVVCTQTAFKTTHWDSWYTHLNLYSTSTKWCFIIPLYFDGNNNIDYFIDNNSNNLINRRGSDAYACNVDDV